MALVQQRYLVAVGGNDGEREVSFYLHKGTYVVFL
jgi:hypothetical protein